LSVQEFFFILSILPMPLLGSVAAGHRTIRFLFFFFYTQGQPICSFSTLLPSFGVYPNTYHLILISLIMNNIPQRFCSCNKSCFRFDSNILSEKRILFIGEWFRISEYNVEQDKVTTPAWIPPLRTVFARVCEENVWKHRQHFKHHII
jgi:hypothetical protein